jgi:monomeric sarcosine oxidase
MGIGQPLRVVVVGAGAMGAAAAWELARRGCTVTLLDQFGIGNDLASSSASETRIFRLAHVDRADVRLAVQALELWHELEREAGERVLYPSGLLQRGPFALRMAEALRAEGVTVHDLDHRQVAALFPELRPYPDTPAVVQPDGAVTLSRRALQLYADLAARDGAEVHGRERAIALQPRPGGVRIFTERRRVDADVAVVCAGPWAGELLAPVGIDLPLEPGLAQVSYFAGEAPIDARPSIGERIHEDRPGIYGLPTPGVGYKLGFALVDRRRYFPAMRARPVDRQLQADLVEQVREDFPGFRPVALKTDVAPITLTPDEQFVIDRQDQIVIGAGCSGHAFKFSPLLGRLLADLATGGSVPEDARRWRLDRPGLREATRTGAISVDA